MAKNDARQRQIDSLKLLGDKYEIILTQLVSHTSS